MGQPHPSIPISGPSEVYTDCAGARKSRILYSRILQSVHLLLTWIPTWDNEYIIVQDNNSVPEKLLDTEETTKYVIAACNPESV